MHLVTKRNTAFELKMTYIIGYNNKNYLRSVTILTVNFKNKCNFIRESEGRVKADQLTLFDQEREEMHEL